jgi:hypothetical protein
MAEPTVAAAMDPAAIITAIGELWKLGIVILIFCVCWWWRKDLPNFLKGFYFRGKWGQAEAEIRREPIAEKRV